MDVETNPSRRLKKADEKRNFVKTARTTSSCPNWTLLHQDDLQWLRTFTDVFLGEVTVTGLGHCVSTAQAIELKHYIIRHQCNVHVTSWSTVKTDAKGTTHSVASCQQPETASLLFFPPPEVNKTTFASLQQHTITILPIHDQTCPPSCVCVCVRLPVSKLLQQALSAEWDLLSPQQVNDLIRAWLRHVSRVFAQPRRQFHCTPGRLQAEQTAWPMHCVAAVSCRVNSQVNRSSKGLMQRTELLFYCWNDFEALLQHINNHWLDSEHGSYGDYRNESQYSMWWISKWIIQATREVVRKAKYTKESFKVNTIWRHKSSECVFIWHLLLVDHLPHCCGAPWLPRGHSHAWGTSPESVHRYTKQSRKDSYTPPVWEDKVHFSSEKQHHRSSGSHLYQSSIVQAHNLSRSLFPELLFHVFRHWWRNQGCLTWQRAAAGLRHWGGRISIDNRSWDLSAFYQLEKNRMLCLKKGTDLQQRQSLWRSLSFIAITWSKEINCIKKLNT